MFPAIDDERRFVKGLIGDAGRYAVLVPGANWETKRWPAERFAGLARRAVALGMQVAVQGSTSETPLGQTIAWANPLATALR